MASGGFSTSPAFPGAIEDGDDTWLITALNEGALDKQCLPLFESGGVTEPILQMHEDM